MRFGWVGIITLLLVYGVPIPSLGLDGVRAGNCWTGYDGVNHCGDDGGSTTTPNYGGTNYYRPSWDEIRAQKEAAAINGAVNTWNSGKHELADIKISWAHAMYPHNDNIRQWFCYMKNEIAVDNWHRPEKAIYLLQSAAKTCPDRPNIVQNLNDMTEQIRVAKENRILEKKNRREKAAREKQEKRDKLASSRLHDSLAANTDELFSKGSKDSAPVVAGNTDFKPAPPALVNAPAPTGGVRFKDVPLPPGVLTTVEYLQKNDPFGGGPEGATTTMDLVFNALQVGKGSLDDSFLYLQKRVREEGGNYHGIVALSYIEGLRNGSQGFENAGPTAAQIKEREEDEMIAMISNRPSIIPDKMSELEAQLKDTRGKAENSERNKLVLDAILQARGDLYNSLEYLKKERLKNSGFGTGTAPQNAVRSTAPFMDIMEDHVGWSAYYYILGMSAYPGLKFENEKRTR